MRKVKISYNHWTIQSMEEHNRRRKGLREYYSRLENARLQQMKIENCAEKLVTTKQRKQ